MSLRAAALAAGAVLVFGTGAYLFYAVHESPVEADASPSTSRVASAPAPPPPAPTVSNDSPPPLRDRKAHAGMKMDRPAPSPPPVADDPPDDTRPGSDDPNRANPKLDAVMDQANKAYDNGDYDDAVAIAGKVLAKDPANIRMKRIMVSSACQSGDNATAQKYYAELPAPDREQMKTRCARFGVAFE